MASNLAWFRCRILVAISSSDEFLKKLSLAYPPRINVTEPHSDNYVWQKIKKSIILSGSAITFILP